MPTRRFFLRAVAGGIVLAERGLDDAPCASAIAAGNRGSVGARRAAGQASADQALGPTAKLRISGGILRRYDHAKRSILRAVASVRHSAHRCRIMAAPRRAETPLERGFEVGLEELKRDFEPVELVAVCQCAGNRRGFSEPHVPGVQWGSGAMGNARWKGVRLKDILARANLKKDAVEIAFNGSDRAPLEALPPSRRASPPGKRWRRIP